MVPAAAVPLTIDTGNDTGSGVDTSSLAVERQAATLSHGTCGTFGAWAPVTLTGGADTSVENGNCYRYRITASDNVGNASAPSAATADAKIGTSTPLVATTAPVADTGAANQYWAAGTKTLFFRPSGSGSFQLTATAADDIAGIDHVAFPDLSSFDGFTGTGGSATSDPYSSTTYAWTAGAAGDPNVNQIVATSNSSHTGYDTVTVTPDSTAPTGQSAAPTGGPWFTSLSVPVTLDDGSDAGAGVDASSGVVERASAPLVDGACGTFGSWDPVTLVGVADTTVESGNCYRYRYTVSDKVGNSSGPSAASADAMVDTTAPSTPSLALTETSPFSFVSGTTLYYNPQGSNSGSFDLSAATDDGQSGIARVAFPTLSDATGGGDDTASPYSTTYDWTSTTGATGDQTVTVHNGSALTSTASFTLTPDTTAPTGQGVDLSSGPTYSTLSVPLTVDWGTDSGAGLDNASRVVERSEATLTNGACDTFGAWAPVTLVGGADTTVVSGTCYRYRIRITDNVGNTSANSPVSAAATVDTSAPTVSVTAPTPVTGVANQYWNASSATLYFRPSGSGSFTLNATASDNQSGLDHVAFPDVSATTGWTGSTGGNDSATPYASPTDYSWTAGATQLGSPRSPPSTAPGSPPATRSRSPPTAPHPPGRAPNSPTGPGTRVCRLT